MNESIEWAFIAKCLNKANLSESVANDIIDRAWKEEKLLLFYYKCELCGSIHLTRENPSDEKHRVKFKIA